MNNAPTFEKLTLAPNELLVVKIPAGTPAHILPESIKAITTWLGQAGLAKRALIHFEGTLEFTKITFDPEKPDERPTPPPSML